MTTLALLQERLSAVDTTQLLLANCSILNAMYIGHKLGTPGVSEAQLAVLVWYQLTEDIACQVGHYGSWEEIRLYADRLLDRFEEEHL